MPLEFSWITIDAPLVPLADTKAYLHITDDDHDADIARLFGAAQEQVLAYLGAGGDPTWTDQTVPKGIAHAILLMTGHYYEHRGDDLERVDDALWRAIQNLLARYRDPAIGGA